MRSTPPGEHLALKEKTAMRVEFAADSSTAVECHPQLDDRRAHLRGERCLPDPLTRCHE